MKDLTLIDPLPAEYEARADAIHELPGCLRVVGLPDGGMSNHETPYGIATAFQDYVVPQLIGRVVSCGMSVIRIGVDPRRIAERSDALAVEVARRVRQARARFQADPSLVRRLYTIGPVALLDRMPELETRVDPALWNPVAMDPFLERPRDLQEIVPPWVLRSAGSWAFPGAWFTKNHFIEFADASPSDRVEETGARDLETTYCAYHFETPLSGAVNAAYSGTRRKERTNGSLTRPFTWLQYARKAGYHLSVEPTSTLPAWRCFLRHRDFVPVPMDSSPGQRYLSALQLIMNYERAARLAFSVTVMEGVVAALNQSVDWRVVFEAGHNGFEAESLDGMPVLVSRKNLVKANGQSLGFIAGMYNMPSMLVRPRTSGGGARWMNSYDHGIGNHLWRDLGREAYERTLTIGDLSQYERSLRTVSREGAPAADRSPVGRSLVYRFERDRGARPSRELADVTIGPALRHVLDVYGQPDSPVDVMGLLRPLVNIKERR